MTCSFTIPKLIPTAYIIKIRNYKLNMGAYNVYGIWVQSYATIGRFYISLLRHVSAFLGHLQAIISITLV
jgi:hypothetical protein